MSDSKERQPRGRLAKPPELSVIDYVSSLSGHRPKLSLAEPTDIDQPPMIRPLRADEARSTGKYTIQGELGRGGVGVVHRGHDQELGRDVAIKFLHEEYKDDPNLRQRFIEEAQIGGQLQHPGIVTVYELGNADGRPFFAMKIIRGRTLAQALAERSEPGEELREYLGTFEQVCQTVAFAHARSVVHRDLKPANVMIGSFGEVQVVDWGMGKVLRRETAEQADASKEDAHTKDVPQPVETLRSKDSSSQSLVGSVMGTPAYMPPEQARGDIEAMDEKSDVFSLGAILCEILTGVPPYVADGSKQSHGALLEQAAMGQLGDAHERLLHCGVDPDLIDLATRCLSAAPSQRPASAQMLAKAMHEHLVGAEARIQDARVKAAESRARASSLRRMQRLGIATTLFFAIGLGISLWFWHSADEQRGIADQAAQEANRSEIRARAAQSESERNLNNFDRLSHIVRLRKARAVERELYPAWPAQTAAMRNWIEGQASEITAAVPELRSTLSGLEGRTDPAAMFLRDALIGLVAEIEQFRAHEKAGVAQRLAWSERVEDLTVERHEKSWSEARAAISAADGIRASKLYSQHPIDLTPQMGLIPIGMNPVTKLWEFYHLRSAWDPQSETQASALELPSFDEQGEFDMNGRGIIFVLIPGGSFDMGAQSSDRSYVNFDPQAKNHERAVHRIELAPFFIAKHEMTRGQWARLSGGDTPSSEPIGTEQPGSAPAIRDSHPVEQVSWEMCRELLSAHGLLLPTESQWEYACRAGTTTPYSSGDTAASLEGFANVLDLSAAAEPSPLTGGDPFRDGFKFLAPVGSFRPNAFGLHDMHGNLAEWCRDRFGGYGHRARPGDALREPGPASGGYVIRGGNFLMPGRFARSADRTQLAPSTLANYRGLRPVRPLLE